MPQELTLPFNGWRPSYRLLPTVRARGLGIVEIGTIVYDYASHNADWRGRRERLRASVARRLVQWAQILSSLRCGTKSSGGMAKLAICPEMQYVRRMRVIMWQIEEMELSREGGGQRWYVVDSA